MIYWHHYLRPSLVNGGLHWKYLAGEEKMTEMVMVGHDVMLVA